MTAKVNMMVPKNQPSLIRAIKTTWKNLPQKTIRSYISHIPTVCKKIIDVDGGHI